jgi:uncharacterized protein (DUF488 family)
MSAGDNARQSSITIFTIGFAKKSAQEFFKTLQNAHVRKVVDIRLNNTAQLAGFTKKNDLAYFLQVISGIDYEHNIKFSPTKEILHGYKKKTLSWDKYEEEFYKLLAERKIESLMTPSDVDHVCFLCSEPKPDKCHRRLVVEYLKSKWSNVQITHL